jgi:hypothetical protein
MSSIITDIDDPPQFRIGFEDLPPEIRSLIYVEASRLDLDAPEHEKSEPPLPLRKEKLLQNVYNPYLTWTKPTADTDQSQRWRFKWAYDAGAVLVKEPTIWQLNRHIRAEAMPFWLRDHLSIELRGHDGTYSKSPVNLGLKYFKRWWGTLDDHVARGVRMVEVRDFVDIIYPEAKHEADPITGEGPGLSWPCEIAALSIQITAQGHTLSVKTPLLLVQAQSSYIQGYLDGVAERKRTEATDTIFDGNDIYELVCWLRTENEQAPWPATTVEVGDDDCSVNFSMWGDETVTYLRQYPDFIVPKLWRFTAASVSLAD